MLMLFSYQIAACEAESQQREHWEADCSKTKQIIDRTETFNINRLFCVDV